MKQLFKWSLSTMSQNLQPTQYKNWSSNQRTILSIDQLRLNLMLPTSMLKSSTASLLLQSDNSSQSSSKRRMKLLTGPLIKSKNLLSMKQSCWQNTDSLRSCTRSLVKLDFLTKFGKESKSSRIRDLISSSPIYTEEYVRTERTVLLWSRSVRQLSWLRRMMIINADHNTDPDGKDSPVLLLIWTSRTESSLIKEISRQLSQQIRLLTKISRLLNQNSLFLNCLKMSWLSKCLNLKLQNFRVIPVC